MKKLVSLIIVLAIVSSLFYTLDVKAVKFAHKKTLIPLDYSELAGIKGLKKHMKIKNIHVRNKKICEDIGLGSNYVLFKGKRIGKTVVSGDVYIGKKFKRRFYTTVIVYKYKNPFLNCSIGNKNFTKLFNKEPNSSTSIYSKKTYKGKINIKLKKGFRLKRIELLKFSDNWRKLKKIIALKNHSYFSFKNKNAQLSFEIYNKKYKASEYLMITRCLKE